jgi:hypothetical protein
LGGHGLTSLIGTPEKLNSEHAETHIQTIEFDWHEAVEWLISLETLSGIWLLAIFVWVWHRPKLKKLVPCSHDHCQHLAIWPHIFASMAFVFHFFPEAGIRQQLIANFQWGDFVTIAGLVGFLAHFFVDIVVIILLSSFWPEWWQKISSFTLLAGLWLLSFWVGTSFHWEELPVSEGVILLISAFLLAMFVHKPHKRHRR